MASSSVALRYGNYGISQLPERLSQAMQTPCPVFSPTVKRGGDGLHSIFSPDGQGQREDAEPSETRIGYSSQTRTFLSPLTSYQPNLKHTPRSHGAEHSFESFKTAPDIEIYSFTYISKCTNEGILRQIISDLKDNGLYPSLLNTAEQRLSAIASRPPLTSGYSRSDASFYSANHLTTDLDSITLSSDIDFRKSSPVHQIMVSKASRNPQEQHQDSHAEIEKLKTTIAQLEAQCQRESDHATATISSLEEVIHTTDEKVERLEHELDRTRARAKEANQQSKKEREQRKQFQLKLKESEQTKSTLMTDLHRLKTRLVEAERKAADQTIPNKINSLEKLLQSAQENIREVQAERDAMIQSICKINGKTVPADLSDRDRKLMISNFAADTAASQSALKGAMKALAKAERNALFESRRMQQVKERSDKQLREATQKISDLNREMNLFVARIGELENDLQRSEANRARDRLAWEAREQQYKEKINEVGKATSGVPVGLFEAIKIESQNRQNEIDKLHEKIAILENALHSKTSRLELSSPSSLHTPQGASVLQLAYNGKREDRHHVMAELNVQRMDGNRHDRGTLVSKEAADKKLRELAITVKEDTSRKPSIDPSPTHFSKQTVADKRLEDLGIAVKEEESMPWGLNGSERKGTELVISTQGKTLQGTLSATKRTTEKRLGDLGIVEKHGPHSNKVDEKLSTTMRRLGNMGVVAKDRKLSNKMGEKLLLTQRQSNKAEVAQSATKRRTEQRLGDLGIIAKSRNHSTKVDDKLLLTQGQAAAPLSSTKRETEQRLGDLGIVAKDRKHSSRVDDKPLLTPDATNKPEVTVSATKRRTEKRLGDLGILVKAHKLSVQVDEKLYAEAENKLGALPVSSKGARTKAHKYVFSGAQQTPNGSTKIKIASMAPSGKGKRLGTQSKAIAVQKKHLRPKTPADVSGVAMVSRALPDESDKENVRSNNAFNFEEKKVDGRIKLRMKMVREAGGSRGIAEKLLQLRTPNAQRTPLGSYSNGQTNTPLQAYCAN